MGEAAAHAVFGYYTAALVATACIAVTSSIQFILIGLRQQRDRLYLSYAMLCLCIAGLAFFNALLYINDNSKWPLQMVLRTYIVQQQPLPTGAGGVATGVGLGLSPAPGLAIKMAIVVIAIVPVLLYHSGWSGMPGGFIGVDIFRHLRLPDHPAAPRPDGPAAASRCGGSPIRGRGTLRRCSSPTMQLS